MIRVLSLALLALLPTIAFGDSVSLLGINNLSKPNAGDSHYAAKSAFGAAGFFEHNFTEQFALEAGAITVDRKYQNDTNTMQYTQKMLQIPLLFRVYLGSQFAIGIGAYYSFFYGDYTTENLSTGSSTTSSYDAAGLKKYDYGAVSSLSFFQPLGKNYSFVAEFRDNVGVKNIRVDSTLPKLHVNDVQIFLGARLDL